MHRLVRAVLATTTAMVLACTGCVASSAESPIKVAVVPGENAGSLSETYRALVGLLAQATGREVEIIQVADYNGVVEGLLAERIDVAELGPVTYLIAQQSGANLLLAGIYSSGQRAPYYRSIAVTRAEAPVEVPAGLRGKRVCMVDPLSTSGGLIPRAAIVQAGLPLNGAVDITYVGGHDVAVADVRRGLCDVAFTSDEMFERVLPSRKLNLSGTQVVWRSERIPNAPVVVRGGLDSEARARALTSLRQDFNVSRLVALGICASAAECRISSDPSVTGLTEVDESVFSGLRTACRLTGYRQCS
ncbi:phosphate/phosphite/phosphonate ABC transporter substrate-binding protein [Micromonospora sp. NPDC004551]|uniref:phosphate/phosphite/phosphonate ABC transporter substrate-binding protein n=1 Tax=Micromonospora sp. NPDC004551 TaxID=3154284 RepID=UPI0033A59BC7